MAKKPQTVAPKSSKKIVRKPVAKKQFKPRADLSPQQNDVARFMLESTDNISIQARAGSGKSSLLRAIMPKNSVILCFGREPAKDMQAKFEQGSASTFHKYGLDILNADRFTKVFEGRTGYIIKQVIFDGNIGKEYGQYFDFIKAVDFVKSMGVLPDSPDQQYIEALDDVRLDIDDKHRPMIKDRMKEVLAECALPAVGKKTGNKYWSIDIADMQWLPLVHKLGKNSIQDLAVDEAQDLNPIRMALIELWSAGRVTLVGDTAQAIFAFQGSMPDSLLEMTRRLSAKEFPLSVCWRCPRSHIELAKEIIPDIEASPKAIEGEINYGSEVNISESGTMILCRNNAPLIQQFYRLRPQHPNVFLLSRNFIPTLQNLVGAKWTEGHKLDRFWRTKFDIKREKMIAFAKTEVQRSVINDNFDSIELILSNNKPDTVGEAHLLIAEDFKVPERLPKNAVVMSSGHSAKGLEHDHVIYYGPELVPSPQATLDWEREQERNLDYVLKTRSKRRLDFVNIQ